MVPQLELPDMVDLEHQQALHTAQLELNLLKSAQNVVNVSKEEDVRRLRLQLLLLEDENDELHGQLTDEEGRSDGLEQAVDEALVELEHAEGEVQKLTNEMRIRGRELETAKAELIAMNNITTDSTALLTSKLALTRELATLKPELEHLRAQAASHNTLLADKLSLERQLSTLQVELENEKRTVQRALAKDSSRAELDAEYRSQLDELRSNLAREQRERGALERQLETSREETEVARRRARKNNASETASTEQLDELREELADARKELDQERRERDKSEQALKKSKEQLEASQRAKKASGKKKGAVEDDTANTARLDELLQELTEEKQEREKLRFTLEKRTKALEKAREALEAAQRDASSKQPDSTLDNVTAQLEELRAELGRQKQQRDKAERTVQKGQADWDAQKEVLDDKLNAFRTKLRSTKEKLKETEASLQTAHADAEQARAVSAASTAGGASKPKAVRGGTTNKANARKRPLADADAAIGTPGDLGPAKRRRGGSAAPGEKSTFSITPFLNRTSLALEDTPKAANGADQRTDEDAVEAATPSAAPNRGRNKPAAATAAKKAAPKTAAAEPLRTATARANNATKPTAAARKKSFAAAAPSLDKVTEEPSQLDENHDGGGGGGVDNDENTAPKPQPSFDTKDDTTIALKPTMVPGPIPKLKPTSAKPGRKSLLAFSSFTAAATDDDEDTTHIQRKKARKLPGSRSGLGKTLFDDGEDGADALPPKPIPGRGMFAGRALGKGVLSAAAVAGKGKGLGAGPKKGPLVMADDGFQFSPLKRTRKAAKG